MTDTTHHDPELRDLLEPSDAQVERMLGRIRGTEVASVVEVVRARRPRRLRLGMAIAAAAAIVIFIALSPTMHSGGSNDAAQPRTARSALLAAAHAAGQARWHPLADDEYHHVYFTSFEPVLHPVTGMDDRQMTSGGFTPFPMATESWLRPDGHGMQLDIQGGGGDRDSYPEIHPDSNGKLSGYGHGVGYDDSKADDIQSAVRYADAIRTWRWAPGDEKPTDDFWVRSRHGYLRGFSYSGNGYPVPGVDATKRAQVRYWGDTYEAVSALDDLRGEELDAAVLRLLDGDPRAELDQGRVNPPGQFGLDEDTVRTELRIQRAIKLLGSAPLSPPARRSMFEWMSRQQHATVELDATDAIGRHGTRVTFETVYDKQFPEQTMTRDELADATEREYGRRPARIEANPTYVVAAHRDQRRWYVSVVFDMNTGELLEQAQYTGFRSSGRVPSLVPHYPSARGPRNPWRVPWKVTSHQPFGIMTDSAVYLTRERATSFEPDAKVCADDPRPCTP